MSLEDFTLDDKYNLAKNRILITGTQAIVRLTLMQAARDARIGKRTAGYVSGYRGSPLGGLDMQFWRASAALQAADILFQPGINEDLAATALWGTQQAELRGDGRYDGVFGIWYGKGPGVDRSGDALRHANLAGTSSWGGIVALMGDDHTCESSTTAHQSEYAFVNAMIPVLAPAGVQEILDFGLFAFALSRFTSLWVGMKCVKDTVESTATVDGSLDRVATMIPGSFRMPPGGLVIRRNDHPLKQEERLHEQKLPALLAFLRANAADRIVLAGGRRPRVGIATSGKSYLDVLQALEDIGIDEVRAADFGVRLLKFACTWPLEPDVVRRFAEGLDTLIVVEEKRPLIESQIKEILYGTANQPAIVGKKDERGDWLFPAKGALDPNQIAIAIGERVLQRIPDERLARTVAALKTTEEFYRDSHEIAERTPYFCPGCPHNSSTVVPEGARAYAGIGCHYMAQWMDRATEGYTHMGAEGANWIGEAPFSTRGHVFQNIGDGTYQHSGSLAIRAAVAAGVNITYKVLFNDAVAMTGGQPVDGALTVEKVAEQVAAEGARRIVIVSDEPDKHGGKAWPFGTSIRHRDDIDVVQRELAAVGGVSVMIYDQTCAAEKRRRRKRGIAPDPDRRVVINELVCEGCGDCGVQSNCVAIVPVETEFGRKRAIDQSSCNKDVSCLKGFCPSLVTVHGAVRKPREAVPDLATALPDPRRVPLTANYAILVTGIGGTGVVTIAALIATAAHLDGRFAAVIDMAGLAQKGGAVASHVRLAPEATDIKAIRVSAGQADVILGGDLVVTGSPGALAAIDPGRTRVYVNSHETLPGEFTREADFSLPVRRLLQAIAFRAGGERTRIIDATRCASALLGDSIGSNMFLLGLAWQAGSIPLSREAIERAIELNGVDVELNKNAFTWGRRAALEPEVVAGLAERMSGRASQPPARDLDDLIARRVAFLTDYQNDAYAGRYRDLVESVRVAERNAAPGQVALTDAVARNLFKLMAIKDEYEVARLFTDGSFDRQLRGELASWRSVELHLAPPLFAARDPATGHPHKKTYGRWIWPVLRTLARLRGIRGWFFDPFSWSADRRLDRRLLADYQAMVATIVARLTPASYSLAIPLMQYPERIRGYGHVKRASARRIEAEVSARREAFLAGPPRIAEAAE